MGVGTYPEIDELLAVNPTHISDGLVADLRQRQQDHGSAYVTDQLHTDGRRLNRSMTANNAQDAIEEIVDAVYALLVMSLKGHDVGWIIYQLDDIYRELLLKRAEMEEQIGQA